MEEKRPDFYCAGKLTSARYLITSLLHWNSLPFHPWFSTLSKHSKRMYSFHLNQATIINMVIRFAFLSFSSISCLSIFQKSSTGSDWLFSRTFHFAERFYREKEDIAGWDLFGRRQNLYQNRKRVVSSHIIKMGLPLRTWSNEEDF